MAVNSINGLNPITPVDFGKTDVIEKSDSGLNFADILNNALNEVNSLQMESQQLTQDFAVGKTDNIHQVMIAAEKADVALQLTMQIRNKILDAYNEIMRMPI